VSATKEGRNRERLRRACLLEWHQVCADPIAPPVTLTNGCATLDSFFDDWNSSEVFDLSEVSEQFIPFALDKDLDEVVISYMELEPVWRTLWSMSRSMSQPHLLTQRNNGYLIRGQPVELPMTNPVCRT
jgi:hypothetical protein